MRKIEILISDRGDFMIKEGENGHAQLNLGEMLEQVISLVYRAQGQLPKYSMMTPEERRADHEKYKEYRINQFAIEEFGE